MSRLLTITQAAAQLGIDQKTLRRWTDAGKVACMRTLGGQRRYEQEEVERAIDEMHQRRRPDQHTNRIADHE